jgi:hypothetical protein
MVFDRLGMLRLAVAVGPEAGCAAGCKVLWHISWTRSRLQGVLAFSAGTAGPFLLEFLVRGTLAAAMRPNLLFRQG